jgi:hypothetical protein
MPAAIPMSVLVAIYVMALAIRALISPFPQ